MTGLDPADLVRRGARIRVHSGAVGCEGQVMAEGKVIAWCATPSLTIEHEDGTRSSWSTDLPIVEFDDALSERVACLIFNGISKSHTGTFIPLSIRQAMAEAAYEELRANGIEVRMVDAP
jgi:hypothetical protein